MGVEKGEGGESKGDCTGQGPGLREGHSVDVSGNGWQQLLIRVNLSGRD